MLNHPIINCPLCESDNTKYFRGYGSKVHIFLKLSLRFCLDCQVHFANPMPLSDELNSYYKNIYRSEGSEWQLQTKPSPWGAVLARSRSQINFVSKYIDNNYDGIDQRVDSWLDIGAGYGFLLDEGRKAGINVLGAVEPDKKSIDLLKKQFKVYNSIEMVNDKWDIISFSHVLEHISEPVKFLTHVKELLSKRGLVFCEVPNENYLEIAKEDTPHVLFFQIDSLKNFFEKMGFEIINIQTCGGIRKQSKKKFKLIRYYFIRIASIFFKSPPFLIDRVINRHYHYSKTGDRTWIRILARKKNVVN